MSEPKYAEKQIYRVVIKAPIDTVWSELVNTHTPRPFFWNSQWDTKAMAPGNRYRMLSNDGNVVAVIGDIVEMDPPRKMVTNFQLTSLPDPASTVTYLLKEVDGGTEFQLVTERIVAGSKSEKSMAEGAKFIVENFKAYVETGKVTFGASMMLAMYALMAPMTPKAMRAENWPLDR
jgi:uncharacterized protein YndB with AHSA1/START domain